MMGVLVCASAASAKADQSEQTIYLDSTNRLTLSLRFGLNISGKFTGIGNGFNPNPSLGGPRTTPDGASYNYDNGYVYNDISGSTDGQTWNWGYDSASQVVGNNIMMGRTAAAGASGADTDQSPGFELTYDRELGVKDNWHHLRYGLEGAVNFMPISVKVAGMFQEALVSTPYGFTPGTTPPGSTAATQSELPYQGSYDGPGFVISSVPSGPSTTALIPGSQLAVKDNLDADLLGFRFGPYIECPLSEHFSLHASGGFALGLLYASADWKETLTVAGNGSFTQSGSGKDWDVLYGFYAGADAVYRFNERWAADVGVQFQDLGTYNHNFSGRTAQLDLSQSVFFTAGVSYSF